MERTCLVPGGKPVSTPAARNGKKPGDLPVTHPIAACQADEVAE
jgi:hypothetical protein